LAGLTNLTLLRLYESNLIDISPLAGLTNLNYLDLNTNSISDISALVSNSGVDSGDFVDISDNPLDCDDAATQGYIATLEERGVHFCHDCP
jgi:Leucine-rich repeat (LRR) protein